MEKEMRDVIKSRLCRAQTPLKGDHFRNPDFLLSFSFKSNGVSALLLSSWQRDHTSPSQHHPRQLEQRRNTERGVTPTTVTNKELPSVPPNPPPPRADWLASSNAVRDRKHSPSLGNNYPSLHADCQRANSSVIIPLLPVESGWQWAQYQSHGISLLLPFISSTLSFTVKDAGFLSYP